MRNLTLSSTTLTSFQNVDITAAAIDLDESVIYATSEKFHLAGDVDVEIWKVEADEVSPPSVSAMFTTVATSHGLEANQVVSLRVLPELQKLAVVMRSGDITTVSLDADGTTEVEGTVESGILAASWSPDDTLLVLVTGEDKLILMTSPFDVLSEAIIYTTDFGEDTPINVGWGSKQTQFHGSLGKAAAQAPATVKIGSSPDDDANPRISWRGDGAFFVVSTLSPPGNNMRRRVLRVYSREAGLQATSEAVAGLEHSLSWRPSGNLIAGTQRFGSEGGGAGKEGRHDVVFFERNGLRHGEFGIRSVDLGSNDGNERLRWGYRVRELSWSSDSNVLALWVESGGGDIVQLWTTGNYHWYLKQEISAPASPTGEPGRFTSVSWHPEQALQIVLTTHTAITRRTYAWETSVSSSQPPIDSGAVAVVDGTRILLTPFRVQNVPPPMSSCQILLSPSRIPIDMAFSSLSDTLAVLWESGYVELWSPKTRLQGGREKVMDPTLTWTGQVGEGARQIQLSSSAATDATSSLSVLRSGQDSDTLTLLVDLDTESSGEFINVPLEERNCRLVVAEGHFPFQSPNGAIYGYDIEEKTLSPVTQFPEFCLQSQSIPFPGDSAHSTPLHASPFSMDQDLLVDLRPLPPPSLSTSPSSDADLTCPTLRLL